MDPRRWEYLGLKDYYDFSNFAATKGLVIVALNYRLGALGWFSHPAIQETQSGLDKASNFGTLDIIEALKWVKNNIKKFGGDPSNVTIFGESAGGHNVLALLASPLSENLFQKLYHNPDIQQHPPSNVRTTVIIDSPW